MHAEHPLWFPFELFGQAHDIIIKPGFSSSGKKMDGLLLVATMLPGGKSQLKNNIYDNFEDFKVWITKNTLYDKYTM